MTRAGIYGRVSGDTQEKEGTIDSQMDALRRSVQEKGYELVREYADEGYSGATLERPGLDRMRDDMHAGELDLVLFPSPDRLARKVVYQYLILEEMENAGVVPEFLNYPLDDSPESKMLLGMQGLFAEYERAKIVERTRRGKLYRAREGALVGGHAPYGYTWIKRNEHHRAQLEVVDYTSAVVRRMFRMLLEDQASTWAIARTLTGDGIPTANGANQWQPTGVFRILTNPAYKGSYRYRHSEHDEVSIPVPAIVDDGTWQAAQSQLAENRRHSRRNNQRHQYLLRSLIRCPRCGGGYSGYVKGKYRGYRCARANWTVSSTGQRCSPGTIPAGPVEEAVWEAVKGAIQNPQLLMEEYQRQVDDRGAPGDLAVEGKRVRSALKKLKNQEERLTDAYLDEAMSLELYKAKMGQLTTQRQEMERLSREVTDQARQGADARQGLKQMSEFCSRVSAGLDKMSFEERQRFLRLVVDGIVVEDGCIKVETILPPGNEGTLRNVRGELVEPRRRPMGLPNLGVVSSSAGTLRQAQDERDWGWRQFSGPLPQSNQNPHHPPFVASLSNHLVARRQG